MAASIASSIEMLLRSDPVAVAAAIEGGADALRAASKSFKAINEALERRTFELSCASGDIFSWAADGCKHDNDVDHGTNAASRTDSGTIVVGPGRAEIELTLENENVEGDETFSVDCGGVFSCEGGGAFQVDLEEAERVLAEGRVERFLRSEDDSGDEDTVTFSAAASAADRAAAARSFVLALAEWLVGEIGGEDEYGVGLGWGVRNVAAALKKQKQKKARKD